MFPGVCQLRHDPHCVAVGLPACSCCCLLLHHGPHTPTAGCLHTHVVTALCLVSELWPGICYLLLAWHCCGHSGFSASNMLVCSVG